MQSDGHVREPKPLERPLSSLAQALPSLKIHPVVGQSMTRERDAIGRPQPRPLGAVGIISVAISCGMPPPVEVPGEFWSQDVNAEGFSCAVVACPCGHEPSVEVGTVVPCDPSWDPDSDVEPRCKRYFFFAGDRVVVFGSPKA